MALALVAVYIFWGSTANAIKIAVASVPPWWLGGVRFGCAGVLMWTWCRVRGTPLPSARDWRGAAITGIVLLVLGNGVFMWTEQYLPSGLGALFFALSPLWMAILTFAFFRERLSRLGAVGVGLGLAGMVYLYSPTGAQHLPLVPTVLGIFTSFAWAAGSVVQRRLRGGDVVQTSAMQMLAASATLLVMALVSREPLATHDFTPAALGAIAYLVAFGSIAGFSAFVWIMNNVPTTLASTYSYVNPIVSLGIGIGFMHEAYSSQLALGAASIVAGVAVMAVAPKPRVVSAAEARA